VSIEVLDESGTDVDVRRLATLSRFALDRLRVHPLAELCVKLVDEDTIAELNAGWMGKDGPTDVLSFPMDELRPGLVTEEPEEGILGDLMICPAVAQRQGEEAGHGALAETELLCVHGILHLLGFDHAEAEQHQEMFDLQDRLLAAWREQLPEDQRTPPHRRPAHGPSEHGSEDGSEHGSEHGGEPDGGPGAT
jgi:probable rRNA maturation factor